MSRRRPLTMAEAYDERVRLTRRRLLRGALVGGAALASPTLWRRPGFAAAPPAGTHLAFGADPSRQMAVSWLTPETVQGAALDLGVDRRYGTTRPADTRTVAGTPSVYHHVELPGLEPDTVYHYRVRHAGGATPDRTFRTAPARPGAFTFTAFGDQGASAAAAAMAARVQALRPVFHFHVGDLCYANGTGNGEAGVTDQGVWDEWFRQNARAASTIPWMPTVGNHEMEPGYGPAGYDGFLSRFTLPGNGAPGAPNTYWFRYGNVAIVALDGNDASFEIAHNLGYLEGRQEQWLRATLRPLRADPRVDFIVVGFHNCMYCTNAVHASDGGVRARWEAIFDEFAVDVVVNGHNHSYERTHPLRAGQVTTEIPDGGVIEPAHHGTTYITAGGGGQQSYPASLFPASYVVGEGGTREPESALWSAARLLDYSLVAFDVSRPEAGTAAMTVRALRADGSLVERVTLRRARRVVPEPAVEVGGLVASPRRAGRSSRASGAPAELPATGGTTGPAVALAAAAAGAAGVSALRSLPPEQVPGG